MLNLLRRYWRVILIAAVFAAGVFFEWKSANGPPQHSYAAVAQIPSQPRPEQNAIHTQQAQETKSRTPQAQPIPLAGSNKSSPLYVHAECEHGCGYPENDSFWNRLQNDPNAMFAGAVALFTLGLLAASVWTNLINLQQIRLARDEFNATHRPKIFIQSVAVTDKGQHPFSGGDFHKNARGVITIANGGDATAFIIAWRAVIYFQSATSAFVPHLDEAPIQTPAADAPGIVPGGWQDIGHQQVQAVEQAWAQFVAEDGSRMFFIGRITYQGKDKITRNTGFCREYDRIDRGAWLAIKDSEYEYAY
ncbi:MAG TPA: hypothetical protein VHX18_08885 [Rhizomicrobium sp.]|jgi:hypothetical protein|nr:hypothetical protein [Rhizomicrobium sp.]